MAHCNVKTTTEVTLILNGEEATALRQVLRLVHGDKREIRAIDAVLSNQGVAVVGYCGASGQIKWNEAAPS